MASPESSSNEMADYKERIADLERQLHAELITAEEFRRMKRQLYNHYFMQTLLFAIAIISGMSALVDLATASFHIGRWARCMERVNNNAANEKSTDSVQSDNEDKNRHMAEQQHGH